MALMYGKDKDADAGRQRADSAEDAAERIQNVTLDSSPFGEKTRPDAKGKRAGPSLLTQQAPSSGAPSQPPPYSSRSSTDDPMNARDPPLSTSAMSVDGLGGGVYEGPEKITVKIADLGNGA